jgi:hypothetical protein
MKKLAVTLALSLASLSQADRIVVYGDEWMFADFTYNGAGSGFTGGNDGAQFALNVASWLTEGTGGNNILLSSNSGFALSGSMLNSTLTGAGYGLTYNSGAQTLAQLQAYNAVFIAANSGISAAVLTQYVNGGGNVFLAAGTGAACEDCAYDPFLNGFGLDLGPGYNGLGSPYTPSAMSLPVSGSHFILGGVDHLQYGNGNNVYDINASDARSQVIAGYQGVGILAVYDGNTAAAVPEPGTFALMGLGLVSVALGYRRRK